MQLNNEKVKYYKVHVSSSADDYNTVAIAKVDKNKLQLGITDQEMKKSLTNFVSATGEGSIKWQVFAFDDEDKVLGKTNEIFTEGNSVTCDNDNTLFSDTDINWQITGPPTIGYLHLKNYYGEVENLRTYAKATSLIPNRIWGDGKANVGQLKASKNQNMS